MLDYYGATSATSKLATNTYLISLNINPIFAAEKACWSTNIAGVYALLEPLIHKDYYTSNEVDLFNTLMETSILTDIALMFNSHTHPVYVAWTGVPVSSMTFTSPFMPYIPMEVATKYLSRRIPLGPVSTVASTVSINDDEMGISLPLPIQAYALSEALIYL